MLKLKLQYFGHLIRRADSLEKTLMLGKIEGRRRTGLQKTLKKKKKKKKREKRKYWPNDQNICKKRLYS